MSADQQIAGPLNVSDPSVPRILVVDDEETVCAVGAPRSP
jgi:hypothetical protein